MGGLLSSVVNGLFSSLLSFFEIKALRAKAKKFEWIAKTNEFKIKSIKDTTKDEKYIHSGKERRDISINEWNNKEPKEPTDNVRSRIGALILASALIFLPACCPPTATGSKMPIIDRPDRPVLEDGEFSQREKKIVSYAFRLEDLIDRYNEVAEEHNEENGF